MHSHAAVANQKRMIVARMMIVVMHSHAAVANRKRMIVVPMMVVVMHSHAGVANRERMIVVPMRYVCFLFGMFYYLFSAMFFCTNSIFN